MFCGPSALRAVGRTAVHCSGVLGVRAGAVMGRIRPQALPIFQSMSLRVSAAAAKPFKLADIGEGNAEVEILQVFVKPGDKVEPFQMLFEVQSDKASAELTSPFEGVVTAVHYDVGAVAPTGCVLCDIDVVGDDGTDDDDDDDDAAAAPAPAPPAAAPAPAPAAAAAPAAAPATPAAAPAADGPYASGRKLATPAVRRLARENNLDLDAVPGSGKDGRVLKGDVLAYLQHGPSAVAPVDVRQEPLVALPPTNTDARQDVVVEVKGIRKAMVKSMNTAWSVPHFGYSDEMCMDALMDLRQKLKPIAADRGVSLSYLPLMLKAASLALLDFPAVNATANPDCSQIVQHGSHNLGVAMDTPNGLVVPNIKNCETRSVLEIAHELVRLHRAGLENKLSQTDITGGTFTVSNIGVVGGTYMSPIIMPPQVAIVALGKVDRVPRFTSPDSTAVEAAHVMKMSFAADHRALDGATVAKFSQAWKGYLEDPVTMVGFLK